MSLRAIYRTLETYSRIRAADLAAHARAVALGSAAKWDKKCAAQFEAFLKSLDAIANPHRPPPARASAAQLVQFFAGLGVPGTKSA